MNQKRKSKLSIEEHKRLSEKLKPLILEMRDSISWISKKYYKTSKIRRLAHRTQDAISKLRSALDDEICSYPENLTPDAVEYYYGEIKGRIKLEI